VGALAQAVAAMPRLRLRGVMAIPEPGAERARYREAKKLFDSLPGCDTLSMGMSDDMELAIAEGATMVRIGTAIFGQRSKARQSA
jgi:PLP dependent protein